jgi:hypothetical protein
MCSAGADTTAYGWLNSRLIPLLGQSFLETSSSAFHNCPLNVFSIQIIGFSRLGAQAETPSRNA